MTERRSNEFLVRPGASRKTARNVDPLNTGFLLETGHVVSGTFPKRKAQLCRKPLPSTEDTPSVSMGFTTSSGFKLTLNDAWKGRVEANRPGTVFAYDVGGRGHTATFYCRQSAALRRQRSTRQALHLGGHKAPPGLSCAEESLVAITPGGANNSIGSDTPFVSAAFCTRSQYRGGIAPERLRH